MVVSFVENNIKEVITSDVNVKIELKTGEFFIMPYMPDSIRNFIRYTPNESFTDENGENHYIAK